VLTATVNGNVVTITWTTVPGATAYNIVAGLSAGSADIASVNLPPAITTITVAAPAGTYYVRVRALFGGTPGGFSNEVVIVVGGSGPGPGPGPCPPPSPPTITTQAAGLSVIVTWSSVPGATSYAVQYSRYSGGTELVVNVPGAQTSHSQYVGMTGTFYVRVVVVTPCGSATSNEASFTIDNTSPGPRTPDPPPGQLLPRPSYGQDVVIDIANRFRGDLLNSCVEHGGNNVFMFRVLQALRVRDTRWGLNWKRGYPGDLSQDIITYNPTSLPDTSASQIYLWDMIAGHCGSNPSWNWTDVTAPTWPYPDGTNTNPSLCNRAVTHCALWTIEPYQRFGFTP
jgi:hypothetical protein